MHSHATRLFPPIWTQNVVCTSSDMVAMWLVWIPPSVRSGGYARAGTLGRVHFALVTIATMPPLVHNLLLCAKMSSFEPNKRHLRELLIHFFNLKKPAAETHRLLVETCGEASLKRWIWHRRQRIYRKAESVRRRGIRSIINGGNLFVHLITKCHETPRPC